MNIYVHYRFYGGTMYEENLILSQIEELVDNLPYRSVKIEVEMDGKTLTLTKDRQSSIGFLSDSK